MMNKIRDNIVYFWLCFSVMNILIIVFSLFGFIFYKGYPSLNWTFIFEKPSGFPIGSEGGIYPAIIGTLLFGSIGTMSAVIVSLGVSVYHKFYCHNEKYLYFIHKVIGVINGIPSIVLGLFGYSYFVIKCNFGISILSGGLVLGLMIFPNLVIRFEKIFGELDHLYEINAYALGVNRFYYVFKVVIPLTYRELLSSVTLAASYAMGATAPIMITGAVYYAKVPNNILSPAMALPVHLYTLLGESISQEKAFATAAVLLVMLLILNLISWIVASDWRENHG